MSGEPNEAKVKRWTELVPSIPAYRNWLSSDSASRFGLLPANFEPMKLAVDKSSTATLLPLGSVLLVVA